MTELSPVEEAELLNMAATVDRFIWMWRTGESTQVSAAIAAMTPENARLALITAVDACSNPKIRRGRP